MRKLDALLISAGLALASGTTWAQGNDQSSDQLIPVPDEVIIIQEMPGQSDQATRDDSAGAAMDENGSATAEKCLSCNDDEQQQGMSDQDRENGDESSQQ